jgi:predicted transposase/invertase (TIGR01784 family)
MQPAHHLIRFDWALKRLLRHKANFVVLEGFLSVLLKEQITIERIGDSESNKTSVEDKFNRVDVLAYNSKHEVIIIEIQTSYEVDYYLRMLYGVSKAVTEHIKSGEGYANVRKIYHINILYFEMGQGNDYVYRGLTEFSGLHYDDILQLSQVQKQFFNKEYLSELFPEYYILRINNFNDVAKDTLDEWIYYLKNDSLPRRYGAPGLAEVERMLVVESLSHQDRLDYDHHLEQSHYEQNTIKSNYEKGKFEGEQEGLQKGLQKGLAEGKAEREQLKQTLAEKDAEIAKLKQLLTKK